MTTMVNNTLYSQQYIPLEWETHSQGLIRDIALPSLVNTERITAMLGDDVVRDLSGEFHPISSAQAVIFGYQLRNGTPIVVKVFRDLEDVIEPERVREAAANEAHLSSELYRVGSTTGISDRFVKYLGGVEAHTTDDKFVPILFFERVGTGKTLDGLSRSTPDCRVPLGYALKQLIPIGRALETAEAEHIVHRDVKPSNIFLDADGNSVLGDFGCATLASDIPSTVVYGTPKFMPPEAYNGARTPAFDRYSFGATMYHLATGGHPYPVIRGVITDFKSRESPDPPSTRMFNTPQAVNAEFDSIVLGLLQKDPGVRMRWSEALPRLEDLAKELKVYQHL